MENTNYYSLNAPKVCKILVKVLITEVTANFSGNFQSNYLALNFSQGDYLSKTNTKETKPKHGQLS